MTARRRWLISVPASLAAIVTLVTMSLISSGSSTAQPAPQPSSSPSSSASATQTSTPSPTPSATGPLSTLNTLPRLPEGTGTIQNVVFILADDMDWGVFRQVPRLAALQSEGLTLLNATTTDSLCCPSRVSIFRSQFIHNHLVVSNRQASGGGWPTFYNRGEESDCLPVWLKGAGVQTAFFGKYLNEYGVGSPRPATYVPPGWDRWFSPITHGAMYRGYNYTVNTDGKLVTYGDKPKDFLADVLTGQAVDYIAGAKAPFFVELSLTNPHGPSPVAQRHLRANRKVTVPRTPAYNATGTAEPAWRAGRPVMSAERLAHLDEKWQKRAQSAESIADAVEAVRAALQDAGKLDSTLIVIGSDNGYHAASRRLPPGKRTPYSEDTVVPYVFIGPGIAPGTTFDGMTSTIDLAPTFAALFKASVPTWADGRSLVPILLGQPVTEWRTGMLTESMSAPDPGDPDFDTFKPPQFRALRTPQWLYVEYDDGSRELVNRTDGSNELDNVLDTTDPGTVAFLQAQLAALSQCSGESCRVADSMRN